MDNLPKIRLETGKPFPQFVLPDASGNLHKLSDHLGSYVVLYVYPKDDTPGCTQESCDFRDHAFLMSSGAIVLGLSADDADSHSHFAAKYQLSFPLLSDPSLECIRRIGAYGTKNLYGRISEGIIRSTFLIDPQGVLVRAWYAVRVEGHVDQVWDVLSKHQSQVEG